MRKNIEGFGWPLLWDGKEVNFPPDLQAMPHQFAKPVRSRTLLTIGFVLGGATLLLNFFPRMNSDLQSALYLGGWVFGICLVSLGFFVWRRGQ